MKGSTMQSQESSVYSMPAVWKECREILRAEIKDSLYTMWIKPLHVEEKNGVLYLNAPNDYSRKHLQDEFLPRIEALIAQQLQGKPLSVVLQVDSGQRLQPSRVLKTVESSSLSTERITADKQRSNLVPHFTFKNFVDGPSNSMASASCRRMVFDMGNPQHNPLFLYGATGLGKSHLMHAVGHALLDTNASARVMYISSEDFLTKMVQALRQNEADAFKKKFQTLDLLLVDDIHLLSGKVKTTNEFMNIVNGLMDESKQIILSSDRHPKEIKDLDPRLVSRFTGGLMVGIEPPDLQTRVDILLKKAEASQMMLPHSCANFIAQHVLANVRELEGALKQVIALALFRHIKEITLDLVREALKDIIILRAKVISIDNIQRVVADYYRITIKEILGPKRTRHIARPRQLAMALARELTSDSFPQIGIAFGDRDHTTVMHACEKIQELRREDPALARDYHYLISLLQS